MTQSHARSCLGSLLLLALLLNCTVGHADTRVVAWGDNFYGQLNVPPELTNVVAISGSGSHQVALKNDGAAVAWGWNSYGQGIALAGVNNVVGISAGGSHNLALLANGRVTAWGWNFYGQTNVPTDVFDAAGVAGGATHSLLLRSNGTIRAWGNNNYAQCDAPPGLENVVAVAAGGWHSVALKAGGNVIAWGYNGYGQCDVPEDATNVVAIAAGAVHTVGLRADGKLLVWGNNDYGQGDVPADLGRVAAVASGAYHVLVLRDDGTVKGWGYNLSGQLDVPVGLKGVVSVADRSIALVGDGPPVIAAPMLDRDAVWGGAVQFYVSATGAWPLGYQWHFDGVALSGATNNALLVENLEPADAGLYSVTVSNIYACKQSRAMAVNIAPLIVVAHPDEQSSWVRGSAAMGVKVDGVPPFSFQWQFAGTNIADGSSTLGATTATLTKSNLVLADSGEYRVVVSNYYGSVTSRVSRLVVTNRAPLLTCQPTNAVVDAPADAFFRVCVSSPIDYWLQWYHDGIPLSGATQALLRVRNTWTGEAGNYWCVVTNADGVVTSEAASLTVLFYPPQITNDLENRIFFAGTNASLLIQASGTPQLYYQWYRNGTALPGATNYYVTFPAITTNQSGNYHVTVSNLFGVATSAVAAVNVVLPPPRITQNPQSQTNDYGAAISFSVTASGSISSYQWVFNQMPIPGANSATLIVPRLTESDAGEYYVVVAGAGGATTSQVARLTVLVNPPAIVTQPQNRLVEAGNSATFMTTATGARPLFYQWYKEEHAIPGATNYFLSFPTTVMSNTGNYRVVVSNFLGTATSLVAELRVWADPPRIVQHPASQTNDWGMSATFGLSASGTFPLSYQWQHEGTNVSGAMGTVLHRQSVTTADAGRYWAIVSNVAGVVTSQVAVLTVLTRAPEILEEPQSATRGIGESVTFNVDATGARPLSYQWEFNESAIAGATNRSYNIGTIGLVNDGGYRVVVSNLFGVATSAVARLSVHILAPIIYQQPGNRTIDWGLPVVFWAGVSGTLPFQYRWQRNGVDLPTGTNAEYFIPAVSLSDEGSYRVIVRNSAGEATSDAAALTVRTVAPVIVTHPVDQQVDAGRDACFSAGLSGAPFPSVQWYVDGERITDGTNIAFCVFSASSNKVGNYHLVASNLAGVAISQMARLTVLYREPSFTSSPNDVAVWAGSYASFSAGVVGGPVPSLQWLHNGTPIPNETNSSLWLYVASTNQAGNYSLMASNTYGVAASAPAKLTVNTAAAVFSTHPASQGVVVGNSFQLSGAASGYPTPNYQWYHDGQAVRDGTNGFLFFARANTNDSGEYVLAAINEAGTTMSRAARVQVEQRGALDRWSWRRPVPQGNDLNCVTYGNGAFVALGENGTRVVTDNGSTSWRNVTAGDATIRLVAGGNGTFVAMGGGWNGYFWTNWYQTSRDGIEWTEHNPEILGESVGLAYGNGRFVAAQGYDLPVSSNGLEWIFGARTTNYLLGVKFDGGLFFALTYAYQSMGNGQLRTFLVSSDGLAWTNQTVPTPDYLIDVAYGNGTVVLLGQTYTNSYVKPFFVSSRNGGEWKYSEIPPNVQVSALTFGNGKFVAVSDDATGVSVSSGDGVSWTVNNLPVTCKLYAVSFGGGRFVAVGDKGVILVSTNGENWEVRSSGSPTNLRAAAQGNNVYVVVGNEGLVLRSTNGVDWSRQEVPTTANLRGVTFGGSQFMAVGDASTNGAVVLISRDGARWSGQEVFLGDSFYGVTYGRGLYVAVGLNGIIATSIDGVTWAKQNSRTGVRLNAISFNGNAFVAAGTSGTVVVSSNAVEWTVHALGTYDFWQGVAYGNGQWVCVGQNGTLGTSSNLVSWSLRFGEESPFGYASMEDVQWAGEYFVAVGPKLLTSKDGVMWTPRRTSCWNTLRSLVYAGGYVLAVGNNETILQSEFYGPPILKVSGAGVEGFEFVVDAESNGSMYRLQGSEDLRTWEDILHFNNSRTRTVFVDSEDWEVRYRYYRVVTP